MILVSCEMNGIY